MDQQLDVDDGPPAEEADERPGARERWLKLALLTIAAGLAATIISLLTQDSTDDEDVSTEESTAETAQPTSTVDDATGDTPDPGAGGEPPVSGTVTIEIDALTDSGGEAATVVNRFNGADYESTVTFIGDPETYSGSPFVQELRFVDGAYNYRSSESGGEEWEPTDGTSAVLLDEGITLPESIVGWSTEGVAELIAAAGIAPGADGQPVTGTLTVADARSLAVPPASVTAVVDGGWDWRDDQPLTVTVTFEDGQVAELAALAADEDSGRIDGPVTVSSVAAYTDLNGDVVIEAP